MKKTLQFGILGAQKSARGLIELIHSLDCDVRVSDQRQRNDFSSDDLSFFQNSNVTFECGRHSLEFFSQTQIIILSPGVPIQSSFVQELKKQGKLVLGEIEFSYQFFAGKLIAITGSNGKTTTVTLIANLLSAANISNHLLGNIGFPFSQSVRKIKENEWVTLEVSSFQLESFLNEDEVKQWEALTEQKFRRFAPEVSILLNLYENHLDRHGTMDVYASTKANIFRSQSSAQLTLINTQVYEEFFQNEIIHSQYELLPQGDSTLTILKLLADRLGFDQALAEQTLRSFPGVEHRLEKVAVEDDITWWNDSKSTNAQAGLWALNRLPSSIILIAGGRDKKISYQILCEPIKEKVKQIIVFGEAADLLAKEFQGTVPIEKVATVTEAVELARQQAQPQDQVLFSPLCTSFDQFKNFEERGEFFKQQVRQIVLKEYAS